MIKPCVICGTEFSGDRRRKSCSSVCGVTLAKVSARNQKRQYRANNRERERVRERKNGKLWRDRNRNYLLEKKRAYRQKFPERVREQKRRWRAANPSDAKSANAEYVFRRAADRNKMRTLFQLIRLNDNKES